MGRAKHEAMEEEEKKEAAWARKCAYEGWKCVRCDSVPPLVEREIFFETKMCGYCAHIVSKDD
jgi:hypothetical protein